VSKGLLKTKNSQASGKENVAFLRGKPKSAQRKSIPRAQKQKPNMFTMKL